MSVKAPAGFKRNAPPPPLDGGEFLKRKSRQCEIGSRGMDRCEHRERVHREMPPRRTKAVGHRHPEDIRRDGREIRIEMDMREAHIGALA